MDNLLSHPKALLLNETIGRPYNQMKILENLDIVLGALDIESKSFVFWRNGPWLGRLIQWEAPNGCYSRV